MQRPEMNAQKRILVTRTDRIGDVLLSTPVFPALKEKFPNSFISVLVLKGVEPIVDGNPWIDEVIVYDKRGRHKSWGSTLALGLEMRKKKFDLAIHLHPTNRAHFLSWLARVPIRLGYRNKNHALLTQKVEESKWRGEKHEAEYNFDLLKPLGISSPKRLELYFPLPQNYKAIRSQFVSPDLEGHYVVFHPSASCPSKVWAPERFAEVADHMHEQYGFTAVIVGAGEGVRHALRMQATMKHTPVNLAGQLDLVSLACVLQGAEFLISNDSGPVHLAVSVGVSVISIFGRNQGGLSVTRWKPISQASTSLQKDVGCIECQAHQCQIQFKCLEDLKVDDVLEAVRQYEPSFAP